MPMQRSKVLLVASLALGLVAATVAHARAERCDEGENAEPGGAKRKNYRTVIRGGRKVFVIEKAFVVCGKVPKPAVIYALQASDIRYEWETLQQDLLQKVIDSTRQPPF